jgi:nucleotide-binding universal stress UspA family protein
MIKDIIVNLSVGESSGPAGDYAVSVAATFSSHLTGVAFVYDPVIPVSGAGYIPADVIEAQERDNEAAAQAALGRLAKAGQAAGVAVEPVTLGTSFAAAGGQFARLARRFDLAIVGQSDPETGSSEEMIAEAALFGSGRPVILVPYIQKDGLKLDHVMVCWDGSQAAARAIGDSMPILKKSKQVEIVIVANERGKDKQDEIPGADLGQHLARHGLNVTVKRTAVGDIDVADVLLSHAADVGTDFIVMGGYGHSRLREFVLGGVTRSILRAMTVPVFMAH